MSTQCIFLLIKYSIDPTFCGIFVCGPLQFKFQFKAFEVAPAQKTGLSNLFFSHQTGCLECEHPVHWSTDGHITELTVPRARLLGLGSKLCPSNMPGMFNKDLTRFASCRVSLEHAKIEQTKERPCWWCVPLGSPNPDPISDQKMSFSTPVFRPGL